MEIIASLGSLAIGVVILWVIVKLLSLPFKLVWNGIVGAVMLWLANLLGGALIIENVFGISGLERHHRCDDAVAGKPVGGSAV